MESQVDLRFLLPMIPGNHVGIVQGSDSLVRSIRQDKVNVSELNIQNLPQEEMFDHILIPALGKAWRGYFPERIVQLIRPGGTLFVGTQNPRSLDRLLFWRENHSKKTTAFFSFRRLCSLLKKSQFSILHTYGIPQLAEPSRIISLDSRRPAEFFFSRMFYPNSLYGAAAMGISKIISATSLHDTLFGYFGIIAQKKKEGTDD